MKKKAQPKTVQLKTARQKIQVKEVVTKTRSSSEFHRAHWVSPVLSNALGNFFLILDGAIIPKSKRRVFVQKVSSCGPFIEGYVFLMRNKTGDFEWDFYNRDGSKAEMCGNAARAVAYFLLHSRKNSKRDPIKNQGPKLCRFKTQVGWVQGKICGSGGLVEVRFPLKPKLRELKDVLSPGGASIWGVDAGVPHFVVSDFVNKSFAKKLRRKKYLNANGANVTFVHMRRKVLNAVTFERGVENFTASCGTGAIAAAAYFGAGRNWIRIQMPGGILEVKFESNQVVLRGKVQQRTLFRKVKQG